MHSNRSVHETDIRLKQVIEDYTDDFWASVDRNPREDIHAYLQYPAMMVSGIQRKLVQIIRELQPDVKDVLDPFVGASTTMTACMLSGLNFTGQDINPLAVLVSRAKAGPFGYQILSESANRIFRTIEKDESERVETDFALRAAISEANALGGNNTITLQAGATYTLTRAGGGEDANATGDLDIITGTLTINGNGATINAGALDRVARYDRHGGV